MSAPLAVQLGTTVTRAGMDVAGVTCVGLALIAIFLPRPAALPGGAARTREQVRTVLDRTLVAVAGGWVALVLLGIAFRAADAFGRPLDSLDLRELTDWSTKLAAGRGLLLTAGCAAAVLAAAIVRMRDPDRLQSRLPLVIALFGVLTPAVTGHAGSSPDHQLAVITVAVHAAAAALWVGGLGALLALLARHRAAAGRGAARGSPSWPGCAWSRSGSPGWPTPCCGWARGPRSCKRPTAGWCWPRPAHWCCWPGSAGWPGSGCGPAGSPCCAGPASRSP